jgi:hypothetical protein
MKKTCVFALPAGLACCALANATPPKPEPAPLGETTKVEPTELARVRMVNGKAVLDGPWLPYTGAEVRNATINAVAFDCLWRGPGTGTNSGPGTGCPISCTVAPWNGIDNGIRWWFGATFGAPDIFEDMEEVQCPPASLVDEIDHMWTQAGSGGIYLLFFMVEDVLDSTCPDATAFTYTGGGAGVVLHFATAGAGSHYTAITGLNSVYGLALATPSVNVGPSGFASGGYQLIYASDVSWAGIQFYPFGCSPYLWGAGDSTGEFNRPGRQTDVMYIYNDCFSVTNSCPGMLGATTAFAYQRCPADFNNDGFVDGIDYDSFNAAFESFSPAVQAFADLNGDCFVDGIDSDYFYAQFESSCP